MIEARIQSVKSITQSAVRCAPLVTPGSAGPGPGVAIVVGIQAVQSVLAHHAVHDPGRDFKTVEGQRQAQGEEVDVVQVICFPAIVIGIQPARVVIVDRAHPEGGEPHVLVELVVGHHGGHIAVHDGGAAGHVGQGHGLEAHTELQVGLGHHPVDVGVLQLDNAVAVRAQRAAFVSLAPGLVADLKENCAGQGFGSHRVDLQTDALCGGELVVAVSLLFAGAFVIHFADQRVVAGAEAHQPFALGLEINGLGAPRCAQEQAGGQQDHHALFLEPSQCFLFLAHASLLRAYGLCRPPSGASLGCPEPAALLRL